MPVADDMRIQLMQENLPKIRKFIGWSAEDLGNEIGITRQTVRNLETGRTKLTKTQYLAIRAVLSPIEAENQALAQIVRTLVDEPAGKGVDPTTKEIEGRDAMDELSRMTAILAGGIGLGSLLGPAGYVLPAALYAIVKKNKS
jgi:DNA-binding XRE family transcriptional regulator